MLIAPLRLLRNLNPGSPTPEASASLQIYVCVQTGLPEVQDA